MFHDPSHSQVPVSSISISFFFLVLLFLLEPAMVDNVVVGRREFLAEFSGGFRVHVSGHITYTDAIRVGHIPSRVHHVTMGYSLGCDFLCSLIGFQLIQAVKSSHSWIHYFPQ
ncbi:hypothetical protein S83_020225 [Arachis hypogaea]|nr:uncharacterized protein DS421_6g194890 [Arachis hypogaea]